MWCMQNSVVLMLLEGGVAFCFCLGQGEVYSMLCANRGGESLRCGGIGDIAMCAWIDGGCGGLMW